MVERQARDLEVRSSNPGSGSNFALEFENVPYSTTIKVPQLGCAKKYNDEWLGNEIFRSHNKQKDCILGITDIVS